MLVQWLVLTVSSTQSSITREEGLNEELARSSMPISLSALIIILMEV